MEFPRPLAAPLAVVPIPLIEAAVKLMFKSLLKRHPALFDRLGEHKSKRYVFRPVDLPLVFVVEPSHAAVSVMRKPSDCAADAVVEGPCSCYWRFSRAAATRTPCSSRGRSRSAET